MMRNVCIGVVTALQRGQNYGVERRGARLTGAPMDDTNLDREQTILGGPWLCVRRLALSASTGKSSCRRCGLYGFPEDAPAIRYGCPLVPAGRWTLTLETRWDLPSLGPGAAASVAFTVPGTRRGDFADASLDKSSIAFMFDCHV
jgi:hypothetical protein